MSYAARVYRILIASPSDVTDERDIAVTTIQQWNDLNSSERQLVLLPIRWETHSAPEYGRRPQEVINRQVVDGADLLVGIFWTRIGSPTGEAESGTLEEIERVAKQGKPVMLYFSKSRQDPDRIDLDQLSKLRDFKKMTFPKALVETYSSQIEFRDKLAKQLEIQLRTLIAEESKDVSGELRAKPLTDIQLQFAHPQAGTSLGSETEVESQVLDVKDLDKVPDFEGDSSENISSSMDKSSFAIVSALRNKNYFREMVEYRARLGYFRPIRFWLKNIGGVGARDVYVDLRIAADHGDLVLSPFGAPSLSIPQKSSVNLAFGRGYNDSGQSVDPEHRGKEWATFLELPALQPQREVSPLPKFCIGAEENARITITARIYADTLPDPLTRTLQMNWKVLRASIDAVELLKLALGS